MNWWRLYTHGNLEPPKSFGALGRSQTGPAFESGVSVGRSMSELLPTSSSNTIQEECFVHVGTLLVNNQSAIALPRVQKTY